MFVKFHRALWILPLGTPPLWYRTVTKVSPSRFTVAR